ncbi:MAG: hypothetical protein ACTSWY_00250 [Promethearchaeota archaeon]
MDYKKKIMELNDAIYNPKKTLDSLTGFEIVMESMVYEIYDLFGRNALLSMLYTIGTGTGIELADEILKERNGKKIDDPLEAMKILLNKSRDYYRVKIQEIKLEPHNEKFDKLYIIIQNKCFFRDSLKKKEKLKIGGPLCRINKAHFETAAKKLTGLRTEIDFLKDDKANDLCIETLTVYVPKNSTENNG